MSRRVVGKAEARAFFARVNQERTLEDAVLDKVDVLADPARVILEYHAVSRNMHTGDRQSERFITTVQLRAGCISHLREYFGPPPVPEATRNKEIVGRAFQSWVEGTGNVFDLLAPDMVWTMSGSGPSAGAFYGKQEFLDKAVAPLTDRLSTPVKPDVLRLIADGDQVAIRFDGSARAIDGVDYRNSYVWIFTMKAERVVAVTAFLDLRPYDEVLRRVAHPGGRLVELTQ